MIKVSTYHSKKVEGSYSASLNLSISKVVVNIKFNFIIKECYQGLSNADVWENEVFEEMNDITLEELLHIRPKH